MITHQPVCYVRGYIHSTAGLEDQCPIVIKGKPILWHRLITGYDLDFAKIIHVGLLGLLVTCGLTSCGSVPRTDAACRNDFRNGTEGVLSDAELASAWSRAQHLIADGGWVINALSCSDPNIKCITHAPEPKALTIAPQCLSVKGIHGKVDAEGHEGEQLGSAIAIDIDLPHQMVWNYASYEMENVLGEKLGFDEGDR